MSSELYHQIQQLLTEHVIGIVKEVLGFRQFSLRGLVKAAGEWIPDS